MCPVAKITGSDMSSMATGQTKEGGTSGRPSMPMLFSVRTAAGTGAVSAGGCCEGCWGGSSKLDVGAMVSATGGSL